MIRILSIVTTLAAIAAQSCAPRNDLEQTSVGYFDLDSLVQEQVSLLGELNLALIKEGMLEGEFEADTLWLDSTGWDKELAIFREANINKPAFAGAYIKSTGLPDPFSNLEYTEYIGQDTASLYVKNLRIYYLDVPENVRKITLVSGEKNELFTSRRNLEMRFDSRNGESSLQEYTVEGFQKLRTQDTVLFSITASVKYGLSETQ